ncbi:nuclear transport factor 2 family protein [Hydrogenophaga sp. PBL-H3]|uniref:nuclear transport factor 2 family protein n=1 Tax=Hydrogenophaga sp. PBL-H3 TaxID=434010 RepID=UPI00132055FE|nr:nuclear transport factor 2 family protein [Hydrogenophaga sp. PBL-H3]QHE75186.1 nuclear transport factor 2 family protein [Hydrogenophaga sp. PBL-H3]QHE79613.1 nuclear transport factor 2 family protein [Hydrogenophaga sp. PBL-H3]
MPTTDTLERFIALVESNDHVQAIETFYAPHASMQENQAAPRVGRDLLLAGERKVMARAASVDSRCVRPVFVNGDHVVIRWVFRFVWQDDSVTEMEELAHQRWEGERIVQEQFFYDPAQRTPQSPPGAAI